MTFYGKESERRMTLQDQIPVSVEAIEAKTLREILTAFVAMAPFSEVKIAQATIDLCSDLKLETRTEGGRLILKAVPRRKTNDSDAV
jgi:hypothetical protein